MIIDMSKSLFTKIFFQVRGFFRADDSGEFGFGGGFDFRNALEFSQQFGFENIADTRSIVQNRGDAGFAAAFAVVGDAEAVYLVAHMLQQFLRLRSFVDINGQVIANFVDVLQSFGDADHHEPVFDV